MLSKNTIKSILELLMMHGHYAIVTGGYIRDTELLGLTPKDMDIIILNSTSTATPFDQLDCLFDEWVLEIRDGQYLLEEVSESACADVRDLARCKVQGQTIDLFTHHVQYNNPTECTNKFDFVWNTGYYQLKNDKLDEFVPQVIGLVPENIEQCTPNRIERMAKVLERYANKVNCPQPSIPGDVPHKENCPCK